MTTKDYRALEAQLETAEASLHACMSQITNIKTQLQLIAERDDVALQTVMHLKDGESGDA